MCQFVLFSTSSVCHKTHALPRILTIFLTLLFFLTGEAFPLVVMKWNATALITDDCAPLVDSGVQNFSFSAFQNVSVYPPSPYLYNGQAGVVTDPNGLLCMRARYYNPHLRRFLNADPIGFSGGSNWYAYADGNPISMSDPFGLCAMNCLSGGTYGSGSSAFPWSYSQVSNSGHMALDGLGLIPVIGEAADGVGALWYLAEGNYTDAAIGAAAMIPFAGWGATGAKVLRHADEAYDAADISMTTLYRAVGPDELADVQNTGQLINRGSAEGKYFTTSAEHASDYAQKAVRGFGDPPYTTIRTQIPTSTLPSPTSVDGGIPAFVIPNNSLPNLKPTVLDWMALPYTR
jgi:RHS repeat-associated protein